MTNFLGTLNLYKERGSSLCDEDIPMPQKQIIKVKTETVEERIKELLEGNYTLFEEIRTTIGGYQYFATLSCIGMSPKRIKRYVRKALKDNNINAMVGVKQEQVSNFLQLVITVH